MKTRNGLVTLLLGIALVGCQITEESDIDKTDDSNTEEVTPEDERDESAETDDSEKDSNSQDMNGSDTKTNHSEHQDILQQEYSDKKEARNELEDYQDLGETNIDLGYGVKGFAEGATGHEYISWNEGRWLIEIDFPLDPENAVEGYDDGEEMAKTVVEYLEENKLPIPNPYGVIEIKSFKDKPKTIIRWQEDTIIYEINQQVTDPIDALQIAVDYENNQ